MPPRDMVSHWKGVMWIGTNICMPLRSLWGNFEFQEKGTNGCSKVFSRQHEYAKHPRNVTSHVNFPRKFREKIWPVPEKSKNVAKTTKIDSYNTQFRDFSGPSSEHHKMPARDMRGHRKELCGLKRIYGCVYVHCEVILGLTRNE